MPYLTVRNVYAGYLSLSDIRYIQVNDAELSKWALKTGDLFLRATVRKKMSAEQRSSTENYLICVQQNHISRARFQDSILPIFAMTYLNSSQVKSQFFQLARTTSGINNINMTQLKSLTIFCPPINLQEKFVKVAKAINRLRSRQESFLNTVTNMVDSLTNKFFCSVI